jgi:dolichol-phosphate mannosyltransferase
MNNTAGSIELLVVLPVYNEEASIRRVISEWFRELSNWTEDFTFLAIDDGSKDSTLEILKKLRHEFGERLEVVSRENRGHGQSCMEGYRTAVERKVPYVFQIDSDGQCDPQYFCHFWRQRNSADAIFGVRRRRDDGWRRVLASSILRTFLLLTERVNCPDANVPYRLIKTDCLAGILPRIPSSFFLANVAVAVLLRRCKGIRHKYIDIHFRERYGGEPKVQLNAFGSRAMELHNQLRTIK